ncbi:reverse transcriptase domain-containing protein [Tanacetum coccineum]
MLSGRIQGITTNKNCKEYEEKDSGWFNTSQGIFCYTKMPFGLKNAGATYQRLVDKAFQKQIGQNLEAYVDDLVIKSCTEQEVIRDVEETFKTLRKINMKLNPKKCTFGMKEGVFLGRAKTKQINVKSQQTERDGKQIPIYFVSRALRGPEINYTPMEKLVLALVSASKRLKRYFQAHTIIVITDQPIKQMLSNSEVMGRLLKWSFELEEHDIQFDATNNEAEYEALIAGLKIAKQMGVENLQASVDSRLVANQVNETYVAKETDMIRYLEKVKTLTSSFKAFSIKQVSRNENKKADSLSKITSTSFAHLSKQVLVEELKEKSISVAEVLAVVEEEGDTWMTPIFKYLSDGTLPAEGNKARAVKRKSWRMHAGTRSVVAKALRIGYYWPTMHEDARKLIQACQDCQVHKPIPRNPQQKLRPITSSWPFYKWGIDIAGPFPEGPEKVKFLIVAIDYFTKWIKAKPVATITGSQIKKFMWDNIVCRFGLPGEIISDNRKQFQDNPFKDWCEKLCIRQHFASVKHPQTNGLVERANRSLGEGIKARLDERSKNWMEELPHVLWAHRTMIKSSNGDTPFSLTYGTKVVISAKIDIPTLRTTEVNLEENKEVLEINLDLLGEQKE